MDAKLVEWCAPVAATTLHRVKDGVPPGCAGKEIVPADHFGLGIEEALRACLNGFGVGAALGPCLHRQASWLLPNR